MQKPKLPWKLHKEPSGAGGAGMSGKEHSPEVRRSLSVRMKTTALENRNREFMDSHLKVQKSGKQEIMQIRTNLHRHFIDALLNKDSLLWYEFHLNHRALQQTQPCSPPPPQAQPLGVHTGAPRAGGPESAYSLKCSQSCLGFIY